MTVTGHPDWLPAIAVVDQPDLIWIVLNQAIPHTSAVFDVRRWASFQLSIQYEAANAGPPANTGVVTIEWADTNAFVNILTRHTYEINSLNSTDCGRTSISDGMQGPFMRMSLAVGNGAASTFTAVMYGSNRPFTRSRAHELAATTLRGISTDRHTVIFNDNVGAGATVDRNARIGLGRATILIIAGTTGGPLDVLLHSPQLTLSGGRCYQRLGIAANTTVTDQITLPRRCQTLRLSNTGGAAMTVRVAVTADDS